MKHCGLGSCARMGVRFFALAGIVTALVEPVYKLFLHLYSWAADRNKNGLRGLGLSEGPAILRSSGSGNSGGAPPCGS